MSIKKGSWKDSNWYVSLTGFWREYKKHRIGVLGLLVIVMFFGMAIGAPLLATHNPSPGVKVAPPFLAPAWVQVFDSGAIRNGEYLPDPNLDRGTTTSHLQIYGSDTYGNESSFSGYYHQATSADDLNYMALQWNHHAGDRPSFRFPWPSESETEMPMTEDFVYFTQTLDWPYERMPKDVNVSFAFSTHFTGDFATHEEAGLMFKVYVWLIDSSGNWKMIYKTSPPYYDYPITRVADLNWFDIVAGWRGMVKNSTSGTQEDPEDKLTLAVGLAPYKNFFYYNGHWVYREWSGSVEVRVSRLSVYVYGGYFGYLGTTDKGGDAYSQLIYGSRVSLTIGLLATALSTAVGVIVGMVAGYFGGKTDEILMRIVDFLLVIPGLPLMMVLAAFLGPTIENIIVVIAILGWTSTSRLIRSQVLAEKNKAYVESARAIGASDTYIIFRHILPNVTPILFANITLGVVGAILSEAGLSFLGLTDPNVPSWGRMLADARASGGFSNGAWWVVVFPGLMITLLSLAFTFVGHTLDQVLNPRLRER